MLFELTSEEIETLRSSGKNPMSVILDLVRIHRPELDKGDYSQYPRYPSIKYASSEEDAWEEFDRCFNVKYKKKYIDMLRPKYKQGKTYLRCV